MAPGREPTRQSGVTPAKIPLVNLSSRSSWLAWAALGALLLVLAACRVARGSAGEAAGAWGPGDHRVDLVFGGRARSYVVHLPPIAAAGRPLPLVLNLHAPPATAPGSSGSPAWTASPTGRGSW
jgi:poly(3-hydroxybutyrate) depolymerase